MQPNQDCWQHGIFNSRPKSVYSAYPAAKHKLRARAQGTGAPCNGNASSPCCVGRRDCARLHLRAPQAAAELHIPSKCFAKSHTSSSPQCRDVFVSRAQGFAASGLPDPLQDSSYHVTGLCSNHAWLPVKNASAIGFFFFSLLLFFKAKLSFCKIQPLKAFFFQYLCFVTTSLQSTIDKTASRGWSENRLNCSPARVPLSTLQSQVRVISRVSFPGRSSAENEFINAPPGGPHGLPDSSDCDLADLPLPLLVLAYPDV